MRLVPRWCQYGCFALVSFQLFGMTVDRWYVYLTSLSLIFPSWAEPVANEKALVPVPISVDEPYWLYFAIFVIANIIASSVWVRCVKPTSPSRFVAFFLLCGSWVYTSYLTSIQFLGHHKTINFWFQLSTWIVLVVVGAKFVLEEKSVADQKDGAG